MLASFKNILGILWSLQGGFYPLLWSLRNILTYCKSLFPEEMEMLQYLRGSYRVLLSGFTLNKAQKASAGLALFF